MLQLILTILGGLVLFFVLERTLFQRIFFLTSRYTDQAFAERMSQLIQEGVFRISEGRVVLDEGALNQKGFGPNTKERIRGSLSYLSIKNKQVFFDPQTVSIRDGRRLEEDPVLRGSFLDRNGVVLAQSRFNEKTWKDQRDYPYGPLFHPLIGHAHAVYGKRGLEKALDEILSGKSHQPVWKKTSEPFRKLLVGDTVRLTLDLSIQQKAYELMKDKKGAVVVLDVKTGEILAAVSPSAFDPNSRDGAAWAAASADRKDKPWENRAFDTLYPPGSTFKVVTASAVLDAGTKDASTVFCTARPNRYGISDLHVHGRVDLEKALVVSCNHYFSQAGVSLGTRLLDQAKRFGFNQELNLIPQVTGSSYPAQKSLAFSWYETGNSQRFMRTYSAQDFSTNPRIVAQGAIGQNLVMATPLQMALVAATIANQGRVLNPILVKDVITGKGERIISASLPVEKGRAMREGTAETVKKYMEKVMSEGTGRGCKKIYWEEGRYTTSPRNDQGKRIPMGGKTGTAEVGGDQAPHSWFIGFAPADKPRVAIAVIAENQGLGSLTAAPIAVEVLVEALNR